MDLRWRLVAYLSGFSVALWVVACLVVGYSLREDVADEVAASARLAELMLTVSEARHGDTEDLKRMLAEGELRHLEVFLDRSRMEQVSPSEATTLLASWLPVTPTMAVERRIPVGSDTLVIRADPRSEVEERLRDGGRILGILLLFSLATVAVAWYSAHRALRPVRELEKGLACLARGEARAVLPRFDLKEFNRIAQAIDRLAASLAQSRGAERQLARRLMDLQEAERQELARELHDELGQSLTGIGVAAAFVERHAGTATPRALMECAGDIRVEVARVTSHVRGMLRQLRPHGLEGLGLVDSLRELVDAWRQRAGDIETRVSLPVGVPPLGGNARLALYRTLQEALTNVLRHSGASRVMVELMVGPTGVELAVADDGRGRADALCAGGGILGMRERAAMAGGELTFGDSPWGGMRVTLWVPIDNSEDSDGDTHPAA